MNSLALRVIATIACGALFGFGLALSGMLDPAKVRGFLDVAGAWDPTLAFVLAGAVVVSVVGFALVRSRTTPVFEKRFDLPSNNRVDSPLLAGAALFGIGWGLSGYCPGPAVASVLFAGAPALVFGCAMLVGMLVFRMSASHLVGGEGRPLRVGGDSR